MPTKSRRPYRRKRKPQLLATRPKMMANFERRKRNLGVDTRVFWFKFPQEIKTSATGSPNQAHVWRISDIVNPVTNPYPNASFWKLCSLYDQYKVLGMKLKMFPSNLQTSIYTRGNTASWIDQRDDPPVILPLTINQVIGNNNARLINSNRFYSTSIYRPKGKAPWGSTKLLHTTARAPDPWTGVINVLIEDASFPAVQACLWYSTVQFKVVFRARVND